jgi:hypothetical protein
MATLLGCGRRNSCEFRYADYFAFVAELARVPSSAPRVVRLSGGDVVGVRAPEFLRIPLRGLLRVCSGTRKSSVLPHRELSSSPVATLLGCRRRNSCEFRYEEYFAFVAELARVPFSAPRVVQLSDGDVAGVPASEFLRIPLRGILRVCSGTRKSSVLRSASCPALRWRRYWGRECRNSCEFRYEEYFSFVAELARVPSSDPRVAWLAGGDVIGDASVGILANSATRSTSRL